MREIIYRVWDKNGNPAQMYYDPFITNPPTHLRLSEVMNELREDGWVWMKYIGLNDKNESRIFEGDIIKVKEKYGKHEYTGYVEYNVIGNLGFVLRLSKRKHDLKFICSYDEQEIIGNIYQNPELLKLNNE